MNKQDTEELWYQPSLDVFLNLWFANYEDARAARETAGGFLLPFKRHFFVCEPGLIKELGLDPNDPDWEKVGWDCARPKDLEAFERLRAQRQKKLRRATDGKIK
jgi:hypothetical protein